jgi:putative ABC transport system ATP-binding protein
LEARQIGRRSSPGKGWLLRDVSLSLETGDRLAICGPTGEGKSLLLRALALLDPLDAGEVRWQGEPIVGEQVPNYRRRVIYLHQRPVLFEGSVESNLQEPFALQLHQAESFDLGRIHDLLARLGCEPSFLAKSSRDLSGGESQIVALLRAIQLDPTVLLLDEPTASLDPAGTHAVEQLVSTWLEESAFTRAVIWVSHDAQQAGRVARRVLSMRDGHVIREQ